MISIGRRKRCDVEVSIPAGVMGRDVAKDLMNVE
jgi:hypothetical protein